jgi:integral membrane protein
MPEFADDTRSELERKAEQLKWVALIETASYVLLFLFWAVLQNDIGTKLMGFFHGWIFIAFAVMVIWIWPSMGWRWYWIPLALLTGPIGGILVYEKIRRDGVPIERRRSATATGTGAGAGLRA